MLICINSQWPLKDNNTYIDLSYSFFLTFLERPNFKGQGQVKVKFQIG